MKFFSKLYIWLRGEQNDDAKTEPITAHTCSFTYGPAPDFTEETKIETKPKRKYTKRTPKKATAKRKPGRPKKKK